MKKTKKYLGFGLGTITTGVAIGSLPNLSGMPAEETIKTKTMTGLVNVSKTYPTIGSIAGTGMVFDSLGKLNKKAKKLL
jgi:hypothetical protein